jgi:sensor histidine kinase YesM
VKLTKILAGIKELEEIDRQIDGVKSKGIQKEKSLSPIDRLGAVALGVPVNKARPSDILKQSDCQSFVRKINREKRERQMRMDEIRKKEEEKLNAELDMNRAQEQYKIAQKEL